MGFFLKNDFFKMLKVYTFLYIQFKLFKCKKKQKYKNRLTIEKIYYQTNNLTIFNSIPTYFHFFLNIIIY